MSDRQQSILITGGSGFIGTNLVEHFLQHDHAVLNLDVHEPKLFSHQQYWKKTDILDADAIQTAVHAFQPTHVVHLAARTDLNGLTMNDYAVNTIGTRNLAEALKSINGLQQVLFTSSMLVCKPGYIPVHDTDYAFSTVYGQSKAEMEKWIRAANLPYKWNIVRPSSIWGPWFGTPYRDFFDRVLEGKMYKIGGKTSATKTYGFVLNTVFQIEALLFQEFTNGSVFYLGDKPALNVNEWTDVVAKRAGIRKSATIPFPLLKTAAWLGDLLKTVGVGFPLTSFRLHNMTTDNIVPLENLYAITGRDPYALDEAVDITLNWIKSYHQK
jgi:GlcNAc-P-P-Und epimerase